MFFWCSFLDPHLTYHSSIGVQIIAMVELGTSTSLISRSIAFHQVPHAYLWGYSRFASAVEDLASIWNTKPTSRKMISTFAKILMSVAVHKSINSGCHFCNTRFHGTLPPEACKIFVTFENVSLASFLDQTPVFDWSVVRRGLENMHKRNIRLNTRVDCVFTSMVNTAIGRTYAFNQGFNKTCNFR